MEPLPGPGPRSAPPHGPDPNNGAAVLECLQLGDDDIGHLISAPPENGSSFTALLELPANQAVELLHSPESSLSTRPDATWYPSATHRFNASTLSLLTNSGLIERAARFSVFANVEGVKVNGVSSNNNNNNNNNCNNKNNNNSPETSSMPSNLSANLEKAVKCEPTETESCPDPSQPLVSDPTVEHQAQQNQRPSSVKRKEREKKAKGSSKKSKNESSTQDGQTLPYVHVRARRGQATDSHSLAERARREKINARMKLLQELVPGCNKISGTALVLDEIINHVQSLQRQVEILSMRLAAVNPRIDFDLDSILATESGSITESNFPGMVMPLMWPEVQVNGNRQQYQQQWHFDALHQPVWGREEDSHNFITPETSLLSYDSSANSASLHSNQLKMEL